MSVHNTLSNRGGLKRHRNVLTREERLARLEAEGRWHEPQSVLGLPKVLNIRVSTGRDKKKKEKDEDEAETP